MKKLFLIGCAIFLVIGLVPGQVFGQAEYTIDGVNPLSLSICFIECQTVSIALDPAGVISTPLITAGCWINFDVSTVNVENVYAVINSTLKNYKNSLVVVKNKKLSR